MRVLHSLYVITLFTFFLLIQKINSTQFYGIGAEYIEDNYDSPTKVYNYRQAYDPVNENLLMCGYYFLDNEEINARAFLALVKTTNSDTNDKVIWKIWPRNIMRITGCTFSQNGNNVFAVGYTAAGAEYFFHISNAHE